VSPIATIRHRAEDGSEPGHRLDAGCVGVGAEHGRDLCLQLLEAEADVGRPPQSGAGGPGDAGGWYFVSND
jgi:hypothetical protein